MSITLYIFLLIYLLFLVIWTLFSLVALYHMLKFGFKNITTYLSVLVFVLISLALLSVSYFYIVQIDWHRPLFDLGSQTNTDFILLPK